MIWIARDEEKQIDEALAASLAANGGISLPLAQILAGRGVDTPQKLDEYLHPSLSALHDPFLLRDMQKAAQRVRRAVDAGERIVVYGDYDADGVTASTLLCGVLRERGAKVEVFLPERKADGYGLHDGSIDRIIEMYSPSLIVTVDCGITAVDEVARAMNMGIDVVVTDHHLCPETLPPAVACVDPKREDQDYPFDGLAGVGVAAKLVQAMYGVEALFPYLDVIAVGTIADIVPLCDENRALVSAGLEKLRRDPAVGLRALMEAAGCRRRPITSADVGFMLAPRINAGGRMASAMRAFELLNCYDESSAAALAAQLNDLNALRQKIERRIVAEAVERIEQGEVDVVSRRMITLVSDDWDDGVIGIVASRLTDRFSRPVLLFCRQGDGVLKASGRSIPGVDLHELLVPSASLFTQFGGHTMAVGLTMKEDDLPALVDRIENTLAGYPAEVFLPHVRYDIEARLSWFTEDFIHELDLMEPVGYGNAAPLFLLQDLTPTQVGLMGQEGAHIRMQVRDASDSRCAIAFGWGVRRDELAHMPRMDIVAQANLNRWQNRCEVQLQMKAAMASAQSKEWAQYIASTDYTFEDSFYLGVYAYSPDEQTVVAEYEEALEQLRSELTESYQGTLVVCNTRRAAMRLLRDLSEELAARRIDVAMLEHSGDQRRFNTLLLAPQDDALSCMNGYVNTYLFGLPAPGALFDVYVPLKEDIEAAKSAVRPPSKEKMGQVFRLLAQRGISVLNTDAPRRAFVLWCIDVFEELGFLRREGDRISFDRSCERRVLTQSNAFVCGQANYEEWMAYLASIEEMADFEGGQA